MPDNNASFARYSKPLSWVVALISLLVSILTFTGSSSSPVLLGFLWLAVAIAFAVSAMFVGKGSGQPSDADSGES